MRVDHCATSRSHATPGERWCAIADRWITVGPGHEKNVGQTISGIVAEVDYEPPADPRYSGYHVVRFQDGRTFKRADCYATFSPYGWNEAH